MKVKEYQCFKTDPRNYQCRIIEIDNWDEYVNKFKTMDGFIKELYPSLLRYTIATNVIDRGKNMTCEYYNQAMGLDIFHSSEIVDDSEVVCILNGYKYTKDRLSDTEDALSALGLSMYNQDGSIKTMTDILGLLSESIKDVL